MRPATVFAQRAVTFESDVTVSREGRSVNGKSPWDLMLVLSPQGSELTIQVEGPDAQDALDALVAMLEQSNEEEQSADTSTAPG